jgi:hypothetical protein
MHVCMRALQSRVLYKALLTLLPLDHHGPTRFRMDDPGMSKEAEVSVSFGAQRCNFLNHSFSGLCTDETIMPNAAWSKAKQTVNATASTSSCFACISLLAQIYVVQMHIMHCMRPTQVWHRFCPAGEAPMGQSELTSNSDHSF